MKTYAHLDENGMIYATVQSARPVMPMADVEMLEVEGKQRMAGKHYDREKDEVYEKREQEGKEIRLTLELKAKMERKPAMTKADIDHMLEQKRQAAEAKNAAAIAEAKARTEALELALPEAGEQ